MPIDTGELASAMRAQLGAEGTQRYTDAQDLVPGINGATQRFQAFMGAVLEEKKGSAEALRDLSRTVIYQTNTQGGIWIDDPANTSGPVWTITALYAEPQLAQGAFAPVAADPWESVFRGDLTFVGSAKKVKRITVELVGETTNNMGMAGNERLASNDGLRTYAYYWVGDRSATGGTWDTATKPELVVLPKSRTNAQPVAVSFLRTIPRITQIGDVLPLPSSLFVFMRDLALNELTPKQGDGTTLYGITEKEILRMLNLQS